MDNNQCAIRHLIEELIVALIDGCDEDAALGEIAGRAILVLDSIAIVSLLFLRPGAEFIEG